MLTSAGAVTIRPRDCAAINVTYVGRILKRVRIITRGTHGNVMNWLINVVHAPINRDRRLLLNSIVNGRQAIVPLRRGLVTTTVARRVDLRAVTRRRIARL